MIKKAVEARKKVPYLRSGKKVDGVLYQTLATGENMMVTMMFYEANAHVPGHSHPEEQAGFVVSGMLEITIGGEKTTLSSGDSYVVPGNEMHSLTAPENSCVVDVFSPPREDYKG